VRVFFAADDNGIDGNQNCQKPGKDGLDSDENNACNGLGRLCNPKFYTMLGIY
jgi:hypothetical protein